MFVNWGIDVVNLIIFRSFVVFVVVLIMVFFVVIVIMGYMLYKVRVEGLIYLEIVVVKDLIVDILLLFMFVVEVYFYVIEVVVYFDMLE